MRMPVVQSEFPAANANKVAATHSQVYYNYLAKVDRKRVLEHFLPVERMLPSDLVARAISKLCATP